MVVTRIVFCFPAWVASIIHGLTLILGPVMGAFLNIFGFRVTTILGCLLCSLGVTLGSFVSTIYMLYVTFSIPFAMGQSLVFVSEAMERWSVVVSEAIWRGGQRRNGGQS